MKAHEIPIKKNGRKQMRYRDTIGIPKERV
jgi:hypothetical protein